MSPIESLFKAYSGKKIRRYKLDHVITRKEFVRIDWFLLGKFVPGRLLEQKKVRNNIYIFDFINEAIWTFATFSFNSFKYVFGLEEGKNLRKIGSYAIGFELSPKAKLFRGDSLTWKLFLGESPSCNAKEGFFVEIGISTLLLKNSLGLLPSFK